MTSEIRANIIKNRVGLGTIEYSNTGPVISGVTTASNFKTGTSNLHSTGLNIQDLDVDGHTNLDNVSIAGVTTSAGIVQAPQFKLLDNAKAIYGNSGDMEIYHNATNSLIQNGTGSLQIITTTGSLFLRGQDDISLNTAGNNERLRITSTGRVGIGTDNPTKKLEIYVGSSSIKVEGNDAGSFHIDPNSTGGTQEALIGQANGDLRLLAGAGSYQANRANILLKNNGRLELSSNSSSDIIFKSNTVEKVRITSTGRVGIGTDNPDEDLVILDVSPSLKLTSTSTVGNTNIYFGDVAGTTQGQIQ
ncbi:MAG: hypothetical protein VXY93_10915, partial [Pseudomonadota bacterium]|nr:hypothetical protein [Pseudomonadota bacterium]